jgi:hypothetical protein
MNYKKEVDELKVSGFTFTVRIEGTLNFDDGIANAFDVDGKEKPMQVFPAQWEHEKYLTVEIWDYHEQCTPDHSCWVAVHDKLADLIYEEFIDKFDADELAMEFVDDFAEEPDFDFDED